MTTVPPDWPASLPAKAALIGEAPAETEELLGRPFVGRAGKVLNGCLRQIGLSRWDCLVTNVFSQRLPSDSVETIAVPRLAAFAALKEWEAHDPNAPAQPRTHPFHDQCRTAVAKASYLPPEVVLENLSRLRAEIERAAPNIVVALGGTAVWALLGLAGHGTVSRVRGALTHEVLTGRKAIASYHPAAVGRNPKLRQFLLSDLARAREETHSSDLLLDERTILIPERPSEVRDFLLHRCLPTLTAVDIEILKRQIDCICFAPDRTISMCVPIWHPKHGHYWRTPEAEAEVISHIAWYMERPEARKVLQYGSQFDIQWLYEHWGIRSMGVGDDTRLMMHALNPEQDKDLASIGGTFERLGPWKMMRRAAASGKRDD